MEILISEDEKTIYDFSITFEVKYGKTNLPTYFKSRRRNNKLSFKLL